MKSPAQKFSAQKEKKNRPAWLLRLVSAGLDLGVFVYGMSLILPDFLNPRAPWAAVSLMMVYYVACEFLMGRTLGKMVFRMKMTDSKGAKPSRGRLVLRTFLRIFYPVMMLSWNRVTLLDALSGLRVQKAGVAAAPIVKKGGKEKESRPMGWR